MKADAAGGPATAAPAANAAAGTRPRTRIRVVVAAVLGWIIVFSGFSLFMSTNSASGAYWSSLYSVNGTFGFGSFENEAYLDEIVKQLSARSVFELTCAKHSQIPAALAELTSGASLVLPKCDPADFSGGRFALYAADAKAPLFADAETKYDVALISWPLESWQLASLGPLLDSRAARAGVACVNDYAGQPPAGEGKAAGRAQAPSGWQEDEEATGRLRGRAVSWCPGTVVALRRAAAGGGGGAAAAGEGEGGAPPVALELVSATFGGSDVKEALQRYVGRYGLFLRSTRDNWMTTMLGDPTPGRAKSLDITYRLNGEEKKLSLPEKEKELVLSPYKSPSDIPRPPGWKPFVPPAPAPRFPIDVVIMTVNRDQSYIHQTLASFHLADRRSTDYVLHLVVGNSDDSYLANYRHHSRIKIYPMPEEEVKAIAHRGLKKRATYNYRRCMTVVEPRGRGLLITEDDVVFTEDFFAKLETAVDAIERQHPKYLLSLYYDFDLGVPGAYDAGRGRYEAVVPFTTYAKDPFECTQGMFYPSHVVKPVADYMMEVFRSPEENQDPYDVIIEWWHSRNNVPIFASGRSLVQHIGTKTTGLAGRSHTAPTFNTRRLRRAGGVGEAWAEGELEAWPWGVFAGVGRALPLSDPPRPQPAPPDDA